MIVIYMVDLYDRLIQKMYLYYCPYYHRLINHRKHQPYTIIIERGRNKCHVTFSKERERESSQMHWCMPDDIISKGVGDWLQLCVFSCFIQESLHPHRSFTS